MYTSTRRYGDVNTVNYPAVVVTQNAFEPTREEMQEFLEEMSYIIKTHQDFTLIVDNSQSNRLAAKRIRGVGKWLKQQAGMIRKNRIKLIFVHNSVRRRILLKGLLLANRPSVKFLVMKSKEVAIDLVMHEQASQVCL